MLTKLLGQLMSGGTRDTKANPGVRCLVAGMCACVCLLCWASAAGAYIAKFTRTTGGVANIEASTLANAGFGTGYAQAQDGICTLADVYLTLSGQRSQFFGPTATVKDEDTKSTDTNLTSDLYWTSLIDNHTVENLLAEPFPQGPSQAAKEVVAGFAAGYNKYPLTSAAPAVSKIHVAAARHGCGRSRPWTCGRACTSSTRSLAGPPGPRSSSLQLLRPASRW